MVVELRGFCINNVILCEDFRRVDNDRGSLTMYLLPVPLPQKLFLKHPFFLE